MSSDMMKVADIKFWCEVRAELTLYPSLAKRGTLQLLPSLRKRRAGDEFSDDVGDRRIIF